MRIYSTRYDKETIRFPHARNAQIPLKPRGDVPGLSVVVETISEAPYFLEVFVLVRSLVEYCNSLGIKAQVLSLKKQRLD
jgi:hypothetical protein